LNSKSEMGGISLSEANIILEDNFAPWVKDLGFKLTITDDQGCTMILPFSDHLHRAGGIVSGQSMMALADTAMVIGLCSFLGEYQPVATIDMSTSFMRPAGSEITVRANVVKPGRSICFCDALLTANDKLVCRATATYMLPPAQAS
jgi:uncharacterized protein (TIGR00369 family)